MHSNLVVRMVFPKVRTLNPAGSQSTLSAPFDGIRECSSSDTWAAPFAPQAGHFRSMVQLSRITIPLLWLEDCGDAEAADLQSTLQPKGSMALTLSQPSEFPTGIAPALRSESDRRPDAGTARQYLVFQRWAATLSFVSIQACCMDNCFESAVSARHFFCRILERCQPLKAMRVSRPPSRREGRKPKMPQCVCHADA